MKRYLQEKVGASSTLEHDTMNKKFTQESKFLLINQIECYHSKDEIFGFFPFFNNPVYDEKITESSFYRDFMKDIESLKMRCISKGIDLIYEQIEFYKGETIDLMKIVYDENEKKITAIKFSTQDKNYSLGNKSEFNKKTFSTIGKTDQFFTGFKTNYNKSVDGLPHLSMVTAYFEQNENFEKYYKPKEPSRVGIFLSKALTKVENFIKTLMKVCLIVFISIFPFFAYYSQSQNILGGEVIIPKDTYLLKRPVKIHTDHNGFTHIKADNLTDGYFALGFAHAKERLWHMDLMRRTGRGKLSEFFGKTSLPMDKVMRSLGLNSLCQKSSAYVMANSKYVKEITSYIDGINYYAKNFILPIEYHLARASWQEWELADSIAIHNILAFTLSHDWNMEIWYKMMEESLGREFAQTVISFRDLNYPFANETIVNDEELVELGMHKYRKKSDEVIQREREIDIRLKKEAEQEARRKSDQEKDLRKKSENDEKISKNITEDQEGLAIKGVAGLEMAPEDVRDLIHDQLHSKDESNCWIISGNLTQSGYPILSNDPHLSNGMPGLFFIAKLYLPDNTIVGSTVPGMPFFATGANKYISWGLTTENSDNVDICEEKIEDNFYLYDNKKYPVSKTTEVINLKGDNPVQTEIIWTRNGPLIFEQFPRELLVVNHDFKFDTPLSFRASLYFFDFASFDLYFTLNHARTSAEFLSKIGQHTAPNYNLHWATTTGEIGWAPIGKHPIKKYDTRFCRGYTSQDDIIKFIKPIEIPKLISPKKGFIVSANNKFASFNYTYEIHGFHNHIRAYRIREMIEQKINKMEKFTIKDSLEMVNDVKDSLAEYILPKILKIVEKNTKNLDKLKYYKELKEWNHTMVKNSPVPTIYSVFEMNLGKQLLSNKIPDQLARGLMSMLHYWNFISGIIDKIDKGERVDLKQCAHLSGNINCEKYIVHIFSNLDKQLEEGQFKDSSGRIYNWGELMYNYHPHLPFDVIPVLNRLFSRKVYTGGNRNTVKIARGPFNHARGQFVSTHSARLKFICEMNDPIRPYIMTDAGNSGSIFGKYYDNLMTKHENAELEQIDDVNFDHLEAPRKDILLLRNE